MTLSRILLHIYERALRRHRADMTYRERAVHTHKLAIEHDRERIQFYEAECARLRLRLTTPEAGRERVEA